MKTENKYIHPGEPLHFSPKEPLILLYPLSHFWFTPWFEFGTSTSSFQRKVHEEQICMPKLALILHLHLKVWLDIDFWLRNHFPQEFLKVLLPVIQLIVLLL